MPPKRLTSLDVSILVTTLNRGVSRFDSEVRYTKSGKSANNLKNVQERAKRARDLRDRLLKSTGVFIEDGDD